MIDFIWLQEDEISLTHIGEVIILKAFPCQGKFIWKMIFPGSPDVVYAKGKSLTLNAAKHAAEQSVHMFVAYLHNVRLLCLT